VTHLALLQVVVVEVVAVVLSLHAGYPSAFATK
jgi:hypothetical protein